MNSDDVLLLMTSGEEKLEEDACKMLATIDELDESLETAVWLNYHRLNLALLHAPKHFKHLRMLSFYQDEESSLRGFDGAGFANLSSLPLLQKINVESIQRQDMIVLLETLAAQEFELESFSTIAPVTRVPKVSESFLTVRNLSSTNWDSVIPYLKFWRCFRPEGVRNLELFDLNSVILPNPFAYFPNLESLSITVKHKFFSLRTFFRVLAESYPLKKLHFESRIAIGDYTFHTLEEVGKNPMDLTYFNCFKELEHLTIGFPGLTGFETSLSALKGLEKLRYLELLDANSELVQALEAVFPGADVVYEEVFGQGKVKVEILRRDL